MTMYHSGRTSGPKSKAGKAISARNATTHGLFCRQTVLPHLGEDPEAYKTLLFGLFDELRPRNLMERQYLELWAEASWKLRRLTRWESQLWEDDSLDEDTRFQKLERVSRLQNTLRRQLDKAVRMLGQDVTSLYGQRTREDVLAHLKATEAECAQQNYRAREVEQAVQANRNFTVLPEDFDATCLDNVPPPAPNEESEKTETPETTEICQNELAPLPAQECSQTSAQEICQNELPSAERPSNAPDAQAADATEYDADDTEYDADDTEYDADDEEQAIPPPCERGATRAQRRERLQYLEDLINSGTLSRDERWQILNGGEINQWRTCEGRYTIEK